ncbi:MAG TPA: radical SAM family heme chaperone HemW [Clostridiales bacterium]|nr:radical SAM family heme chaperone HemW [Clostridiales bacterium]
MDRQPIGLYLHIPFCRRGKCPYCDFYSLPFGEDLADAYTAALIEAMATQPFGPMQADTVYFGGGTPSLLGARRLDALLEAAARFFALPRDCEVTLEANPESVTPELLQSLRRSGFTRVSVGVQSGVDSELAALGRPHTARQARQAIEWAYQAGFAHISADLMLAIPGQGEESLRQSVSFLTGLPVDHISAYLLKIEEGTPFAQKRRDLSLPDEDTAADCYLLCSRLLEEAGFPRYEISNFAKPGGQCRHNLKYWRCQPYLGLGPAAHSYLPQGAKGRRYAFPRDLKAFLTAENPFALLEDQGEGGGWEERLMLALRLEEGFDAKTLPDPSARRALLCKAKELATRNLCQIRGEVISLTGEGMLLSNSVTVALLEALESGLENYRQQ